MARTTIVGGTTTNTIGEVNAYFSDGSIVTDVKLASVYKGATKGANLGNFKSKPQPTPEYNLNIDLAWLSMVIMYDDTWYTVGETYFQRPGNDTYKFKLVHAQREEFWGFRFYVFGFIMYDKEFYTGVFMGTRTNNWYSLTDNVSQAARISVQVKWAKEMGVYCRRHFPNIIFAGHSKGGREAAFAAVHHGFATVYSYNTSIAYLEDQRKKLTEWQQNGGVMIHYTVAGEVLMMSGLNGWNGGFKPTILTPDGVLLRDWEKLEIVNGKIRKYVISYHSWEAGHHPNTPDGEKVQIGEMISRHSDWSLMYLGLAKIRGEMRPGTLRYLTRNVLNFLNIV